jgi:hypothetical protein
VTLCIGMATYDDYDGVYFTVQAIRLYHPEVAAEISLLVVDNHPEGPCAKALQDLMGQAGGRYVAYGDVQGTAVRERIFQETAADYVLCVDSHVLLRPGALAQLLGYIKACDPETRDLWQGPLLGDDLRPAGTHFDPVWRAGMWGIWAVDPRGVDPDGPPFDIPMQGLGVFGCRRAAWPGFNPRFRGFGGEEGYLHEKIRRAGGRTLCLPFLGWMHRFQRPYGTRYAVTNTDRIRNYLIGHRELGLDTGALLDHFRQEYGHAVVGTALMEAER